MIGGPFGLEEPTAEMVDASQQVFVTVDVTTAQHDSPEPGYDHTALMPPDIAQAVAGDKAVTVSYSRNWSEPFIAKTDVRAIYLNCASLHAQDRSWYSRWQQSL